ncbi:MAG TPA: AraD1 family protein [Chthonomonadaceae bacterium]|nr:AraD1 family protein [Chthonomonadaceae bacterium]
MLRLVQIIHPSEGRRVAVVEEPRLRLLCTYTTLYACANTVLEQGERLSTFVASDLSEATLDYDSIYSGSSDWRLLPPFDHPEEPARCLVSGTGLTHRKSAANRAAMHQTRAHEEITESMRMYQWGAEGGRPQPGEIGAQPEWFYKGNGLIVRACGEMLDVPDFAEDGGEEPEVVGVYLVGKNAQPYRVGFAIGNEFSDHILERKSYLYLAPSKLRVCAMGPELLVDAPFDHVSGTVRVERAGQTVWSHDITTGEDYMVHTLANLEYHHFKYPAHRRPGDVHLHFFGADAFSFGAGIALEEGDIMEVAWTPYGRPLRNPVHIDRTPPHYVAVKPL